MELKRDQIGYRFLFQPREIIQKVVQASIYNPKDDRWSQNSEPTNEWKITHILGSILNGR